MGPRQEVSLLPFLYQTRTILQRNAGVKRHGLQRKGFLSSARCEQRQPEQPSRWPSRLMTLDPESQADILPSFNPNSTLTPLEDQKFRRIFEAAARGLPPPSQQKHDELADSSYKPGESLDKIFQKHGLQAQDEPTDTESNTTSVDNEQQQGEKHGIAEEVEIQASVKIRKRRSGPIVFPEALRGAWRDVQRSMHSTGGSVQKKTAKESKKRNKPLTKQQKELEELQTTELRRVRMLFDSAENDKAIWSLLEREVFAPMKEVIEAIRKGAGKEISPPSNKNRRSEAKAEKQAVQRRAAVTQGTYQAHLVNALRALRTRFPRSPFSSAVMPTIQKLDPISHVLGSGTGLYNELLYMAWRQRADVAECARLVEDMYAQGLHADDFTNAVFVDAQREMRASLSGKDSVNPARRMWWHLQGVQGAMTRWHAVMDLHDARAEEEQRSQEEWEQEQRDFDIGPTSSLESAEKFDDGPEEALEVSANAP